MKHLLTFFVALCATIQLFAQSQISVIDGTLADWDSLPQEYVASCVYPEGATYDGLLSMKVYADQKYINMAVEYNPAVITDHSWVPFHVYFDTDNSTSTGGFSDQWTNGSVDVMLETAVLADGTSLNYNPAVFWWWGPVGGSGWYWTDPNQEATSENGWGAIVPENSLPIGNSQIVGNTIEIQLLRELIPAPSHAEWANTFRVGVDIMQSWMPVGILPTAPDTDEYYTATAEPLVVQIDNSSVAEFEHEGLRYVVNGANSVAVATVVDRYQMTTAIVPPTVTFSDKTYTVTEIGDEAFEDCVYLTSITIPNTVTRIGDYAFNWCRALSSVVIPESVTSVGDYAFGYCSALESAIIGNGVKSIGDYAFLYCPVLKSITIGNNVQSIGNAAFSHCSALTSIVLPEGVTSVGNKAFYRCESLNHLSIPSSVVYDSSTNGFTSICHCLNLKTLIVPADFFLNDYNDHASLVDGIYPYLPQGLESLTINGGNMNDYPVGWDFIYRNCKTLKHIDFSAAESIPEKAFIHCYNLQTLALPSALTTIPYMSVAECVSLQSITIPAQVIEIEARAFENCRMLSSVTFEEGQLARIGNWAFYNCHELQHIVLPEGVSEIGHAAFYGCAYLSEMTLPSTVQEIADNSFAFCSKLKAMHVNAITPPMVYAKTFENVDRSIPVYVPEESVNSYKSAPVWQEFNIVGKQGSTTAVGEVPAAMTDHVKTLRHGQLLILRDGKTYNAMGQEL